MKKYLAVLLGMLIMLVLSSCESSDSDTLAQREIRDILYDISYDFNLKDMNGIMEHLHNDYLHRGMNRYNFNNLWLNRMTLYSLLEIEVLYIDLNGNSAIVYSKNKFMSNSDTQILNEPEESGDISYFKRDNGVWYIYGDQHMIKSKRH